jgi:hypothetical protein
MRIYLFSISTKVSGMPPKQQLSGTFLECNAFLKLLYILLKVEQHMGILDAS